MGKKIIAVWVALAVAVFAAVYLFTFQKKLRPLSCIFVPLLLVTICLYPVVLVKFVTALALVSFILTIYYISVEKDLDFVYGVLYAFYAFLLLKWIRPYAFLTLRDGRWLTR